MEYFWTYTIWYILLGFLTVCELVLIFSIVKEPKFSLAFYFTVAGAALTVEVTLFFLFSAYDYYPKIILTSYYDDELTGNLFSQFSIAATALLIAVFNLKIYWILIFAGAYGIIEELFLGLGIYSHNWYRTWMTVVGLIFFFGILKINYKISLHNPKKVLHYLNIFFALITLDVITIIWGFMLSGNQSYSQNLGYNSVASPYLVANLYSYVVSVSLMTMYFRKFSLLSKILIVLLLYIFTLVLNYLSIIYFKNGWWFLTFTTVYIFCDYFSIVLMDYLYTRGRA